MSTFDMYIGQYVPVNNRKLIFTVLLLGVSGVVGAIAAEHILLAVAVVFMVMLALAVMIWPAASIFAVVFIIYTNAAVIAVKFHHVPVILGAAVPLLLLIPFSYNLIVRREKILIDSVFLLMLLFLVVHMIGTIFALYIKEALDGLITYLVEGIGIYFLIINTVRSSKVLRGAIWMLMLAGIFIGGLSLFQQVTGTFDNNYGGFAQAYGVGFGTGEETIDGEVRQLRLSGPIGEKNRYAQVMLLLIPLGLFRFWGESSKKLRLLALIATGLSAVGMVLAFSRGAAVGFFLMLVIMTFMRYIKPYQLLVVALGIALILIVFPQYAERLVSLQSLTSVAESNTAGISGTDGATQGRLGEMWAAGLVFVDYPLIGVGPGMFKYYYQEYANIVGLQVHTTTREAHNLYLGLAAEYGAFGLLFVVGILFLTMRNLARIRSRWEHERPEFVNMATGFILTLAGYMTTGLFLHMSYIRYFWLMMALANAVIHVTNKYGSEAVLETAVTIPVENK